MSIWGILSFVCFALFILALLAWGILRGLSGSYKKQTIEEERKAKKLKKAAWIVFFVVIALLLLGILGIILDHQTYLSNAKSYVDKRMFG